MKFFYLKYITFWYILNSIMLIQSIQIFILTNTFYVKTMLVILIKLTFLIIKTIKNPNNEEIIDWLDIISEKDISQLTFISLTDVKETDQIYKCLTFPKVYNSLTYISLSFPALSDSLNILVKWTNWKFLATISIRYNSSNEKDEESMIKEIRKKFKFVKKITFRKVQWQR